MQNVTADALKANVNMKLSLSIERGEHSQKVKFLPVKFEKAGALFRKIGFESNGHSPFQKQGDYDLVFAVVGGKLDIEPLKLGVSVRPGPPKTLDVDYDIQSTDVLLGGAFPSFLISRKDVYDNLIPFDTIPKL